MSDEMITITEAALMLGVTSKTLRRWDKEGRLSAHRSLGGHRRYFRKDIERLQGLRPSLPPHRIVAYCRVSGRAQRPDLANQREAVEVFASARGFADLEVIEEIGGGMNFNRKKFVDLMDAIEAEEVKTLIVAHKDRLCRFGFDWFLHLCEKHGCELLVMNQQHLSPEQEMVEDLLAIVHIFSARLYGLRSYKKKLKKDLNVISSS